MTQIIFLLYRFYVANGDSDDVLSIVAAVVGVEDMMRLMMMMSMLKLSLCIGVHPFMWHSFKFVVMVKAQVWKEKASQCWMMNCWTANFGSR